MAGRRAAAGLAGQGIGEGYAAVSVAGGRIYTMGEDTQSSYVHALDATGKKSLVREGRQVGGGGLSGPACDAHRRRRPLYALGQFGDLVCVDADDGKEIWRKNLEKDFKGQMMSGWGYSESALVDGDKVVCTPGGRRARSSR